MWPIWFRSEISSGKDFEILWKFVIFQIFISTVLSNLHSTDVIPPLYWCYPPTVLKVSPHCTEYPPQYWCYPPTVLMLSPTCTDVIPPMYWIPSTVLKLSPHCTEQPPKYWSYPPQYWCYPPDVLNNLQCTEQPPQYWTDVMWGVNLARGYFSKFKGRWAVIREGQLLWEKESNYKGR